jgi:hypothetical protein
MTSERLSCPSSQDRVATQAPGSAATVTARFDWQVACRPDAIAVSSCGTAISYAALAAHAHLVAERLAAAGTGPDDTVALIVSRSVEVIVGLVGIVKAGATCRSTSRSPRHDSTCCSGMPGPGAPSRRRLESGLPVIDLNLPQRSSADDRGRTIHAIVRHGDTGRSQGQSVLRAWMGDRR